MISKCSQYYSNYCAKIQIIKCYKLTFKNISNLISLQIISRIPSKKDQKRLKVLCVSFVLYLTGRLLMFVEGDRGKFQSQDFSLHFIVIRILRRSSLYRHKNDGKSYHHIFLILHRANISAWLVWYPTLRRWSTLNPRLVLPGSLLLILILMPHIPTWPESPRKNEW